MFGSFECKAISANYVTVSHYHVISIDSLWYFLKSLFLIAASLVTGEENDYIHYDWCGQNIGESIGMTFSGVCIQGQVYW